MKKNLVVSAFVFLFVVCAHAQYEETVITPRFRLGVEAGVSTIFGEANKLPMIRENKSSYYYDGYDYDYYGGFIYDEKDVNFFYLGLKPEYLIHRRVAVALGVRFSFNKIVYDSDRDYFLWKVNEDENETSYLRIKDISQKNYYLGIPIEIKIFPRELDYFVRHYFAFGTVLNFLATSTEDVSFKNPAMKKHTPDVLNQIEKANAFHGCVYAGFGLKIGRTNHPFGNIEFQLPVLMFANDKPNSLVKTEGAFGLGIRATLQIPIFKKYQLEYVVND